jgi:hypothetical protein
MEQRNQPCGKWTNPSLTTLLGPGVFHPPPHFGILVIRTQAQLGTWLLAASAMTSPLAPLRFHLLVLGWIKIQKCPLQTETAAFQL